MADISARRPTLYVPLTATLLGFLIGGVLIHGITRALGIDLAWMVHRAALRFFPPPPLGIHVLDPEMGWRHVPNATGRHETKEFKVVYSIDSAGARLVPGAGNNRPIIDVLGDSFTFGHGVEDNETYAAVLQRLLGPEFAVRNRGVMGWGTLQSMRALEKDFARGDPVRLVIYGWLPFQNQRNYRSKGWLQLLAEQGQRLPLFEVVQGRPVFRRLIGPDEGLPDGTEDLRRAEWALTEAAMNEMATIAADKQSQLLVILLPFQFWMGSLTHVDATLIEDSYTHLEDFLRTKGIAYRNLKRDGRFSREGLYIPHDLHPTALWHRLVAEALAESVKTNGTVVALDTPPNVGRGDSVHVDSAPRPPSPDMAALVALPPGAPPNTVTIPGPTGTALFGVTTLNMGGAGTLIASAEADNAAMPIGAAICQTFQIGRPQAGQCQTPFTDRVTVVVEPNATPSFAVALTATGPIPPDQDANRITVRFRDAQGIVRGSASVAVRTQ